MIKIKFFLFGMLYVFSVESTFSQTEKGSFLIGGQLFVGYDKDKYYYSSGRNDVMKTFEYDINPAVSYFFTRNFSIGISTPLSFENSSVKDYDLDYVMERKSTEYSVGPVFRYYVPIKSWAFFVESTHVFEWDIDTFERPGFYSETKGKNLLSRLGIGTTYFINKSVGIEGLLFYQYKLYLEGQGLDDDTSRDNSSVNFRIGVQVYLSKKKGEAKSK